MPPANGTMVTYARLTFEDGYTVTIHLTGTKNTGQIPTLSLSASPSPFNFTSFTSATSTQSFTLINSSTSPLTVSSITSPQNSRFTIANTMPLTVAGNGTQSVSVLYTPTDFTAQTTTLNINSNDPAGTATVTVNATRATLYQLTISPTSVTVKPSIQTQSVYITNTGNVAAAVNSVINNNATLFTV